MINKKKYIKKPTVQSFWYGDSLSSLEKVCIESFLSHGFSYDLYVYNPKIKNVPSRANLKNASKILSEDKVFRYKKGFNKGSVSGFANMFRYCLLYKKGGIWVDTDISLVSDDLEFNAPEVFIIEEGDISNGKFANSIIKAKKESRVMEKCIKEFKRYNKKHMRHGETGPELLTRSIRSLPINQMDVELKSKEKYYPIHWEKSKRLFYDDLKLNESWITIHFWNAWVMNQGINKNREFPKWSIFSKLKKKYLN